MMRFIAAIDEKRGIADDNGIPWDLPTDKKFFVDQTKEGIILMGHATYLEFKEPMHGRINYVATRKDRRLRPGFIAVHDIPSFVKEHKDEVINNIGGAGLFTSTLMFADELVLTPIQADFNCTKFFPPYKDDFQLVHRSEPIKESNVIYHFETWKRK